MGHNIGATEREYGWVGVNTPFYLTCFLGLMGKHLGSKPFTQQLRDTFKISIRIPVANFRHVLTSTDKKLESRMRSMSGSTWLMPCSMITSITRTSHCAWSLSDPILWYLGLYFILYLSSYLKICWFVVCASLLGILQKILKLFVVLRD